MSRERVATSWTRRYGFWVACVTLLAWLLREYYVLVTIVDVPIRGDIREYVLYAWNLAYRGVFGMTNPGSAVAIPDAYRSPGFPWLIALCMRMRPQGNWYALALQCQVLLGTATVTTTMLLARRWLTMPWGICAGLLLALWPHHIAASGTLLSEVAFGCALSSGLWAFTAASEGQRFGALLAGAAFGFAYLINPLIALFPAVLVALLCWNGRSRAALVLLGLFLVPVFAFAARNFFLPSQSPSPHTGRAVMNLVQGSWPQYHDAWRAQASGDPIATAVLGEMNREISTTERTPIEGARQIATRMGQDPGYYASWYLARKPMLLWAWDIRIGSGGPYVLDVRNSPLDHHPLLIAIGRSLRAATPMMTLGAFAAALFLLVGGLRRKNWAPIAALATAALGLYLTGVHDVFQAEPRYANAYRGIEALLVATALQATAQWIKKWRGNSPEKANPAPNR